MKIIKEGFGENWSLQIKCKCVKDSFGFTYDSGKEHCGSLLEINSNDVEYASWFKYPSIEGHDYICRCPKCKCKLLIDRTKLPEWVKENARKRI